MADHLEPLMKRLPALISVIDNECGLYKRTLSCIFVNMIVSPIKGYALVRSHHKSQLFSSLFFN